MVVQENSGDRKLRRLAEFWTKVANRVTKASTRSHFH